MLARLLAISGPLTGTIRHLDEASFSIGRDKSNDLCLDTANVSRRHCRIEGSEEQYEICDLDSRNGTFVNGVPVKLKLMEHGDTLRVGSSEFVFLTHEGEPLAEPWISLRDGASSFGLSTVGLEHTDSLPAFGVEVGRMARDLGALFKISDAITSIRDANLLQREILRLIFEVIPADSGTVLLLSDLDDEESGTMCTWNRKSGAGPAVELQREFVRRAIWERSAVFTSGDLGASGKPNVLCVPLVAVERTIGAIYLTSFAPAPPFQEDHIHFLGSVSRIAAVTLENILALDALRSENRLLKKELDLSSKLVGESRQIGRVEEFISRVANSDSSVLIRGESGTGKEVVARALHQKSARNEKPFVAINCAAIPETLLESELFGHEKGAFTGAVGLRKGKLEAAGDGTLFLDEIGELAMPMQAKLLRVLQQREFERVGGSHTLTLKARVLAATNKNLEEAIKTAQFRQDLYYRLNVVSVTIPPLREHSEDVPLLALFFATKFAARSKRPFKGISREARSLLTTYSWPGNVRELENAIEHAIVLGQTEEILPEDLPPQIFEEQSSARGGSRYHDALEDKKKQLLLGAMNEANNHVPTAARLLGIHPKYLHRLVRNLDLKTEVH